MMRAFFRWLGQPSRVVLFAIIFCISALALLADWWSGSSIPESTRSAARVGAAAASAAASEWGILQISWLIFKVIGLGLSLSLALWGSQRIPPGFRPYFFLSLAIAAVVVGLLEVGLSWLLLPFRTQRLAILDWALPLLVLTPIFFILRRVPGLQRISGHLTGAGGLCLAIAIGVGIYAWYLGEPLSRWGVSAATTTPVFRCAASNEWTTVRCALSDTQWVAVPPEHPMARNAYDLCLSASGPPVEWRRVGNVLWLRASPGASGQVAAYRWFPHPAICPSLI